MVARAMAAAARGPPDNATLASGPEPAGGSPEESIGGEQPASVEMQAAVSSPCRLPGRHCQVVLMSSPFPSGRCGARVKLKVAVSSTHDATFLSGTADAALAANRARLARAAAIAATCTVSWYARPVLVLSQNNAVSETMQGHDASIREDHEDTRGPYWCCRRNDAESRCMDPRRE